MLIKTKLHLFLTVVLSPAILIQVILLELPICALTSKSQNYTDVNIRSSTDINHNLQIAHSRRNTLVKAESIQIAPHLKQSLNNIKPSVPESERSPEFTIAQVIPIDDFKAEPPEKPEKDEDEAEPNTTIPPLSNEAEKQPETTKKPYNLSQQLLIQKLRQSKSTREQTRVTILDALTSSASRYPWITNPTDRYTFPTQLFKPNEDENYIDTDLRINSSQTSQNIDKFTYANFPKNEQFYWLLSNNRLVFETKGSQIGIAYQGRSSNTYITQNMTSVQSFWGLQSLVALPPNFEELTGEVDINNLTVISTAGQVINPEGIPAGRVVINSGIDPENPNVTVLRNSTPLIGGGSTFSPDGGGALFDALDASNTPQIIQAFPTTDLKPLLDDGNIQLVVGQTIPNSVLEASGIFWGDILTGEGFGFAAPVSSVPGIKIAQRGRFDNVDLLKIITNPFLTPVEKDLSYLNSLFWISFGKRQPEFETLSQTQSSANWHRFYLNYPHNRSIIQYDPLAISATYSNIFASPGFSLTTNFSDFSIDSTQSINTSLGMALGGIFKIIKIDEIDQGLAEARQKFQDGESFTSLNTTATPNQRRQINQRLNRTLAYANSASGLEQVSGTITLPSKINPHSSNIFQIRTGNHRRVIQFLERQIELLEPGETFFSDLKLSNRIFGPLTFVGIPNPLNNTAINPINESSAAEVILVDSAGRQIVQTFSSTDNTIVPLNVRTFDLAFDYMELTRVDKIGISFNSFSGNILLPSVEFLAAGTYGDLNYSATLGTWLNIDANSAPGGVSDNNVGITEPTVGVYSNILVNHLKTYVVLDSNKRPIAINNHSPFFRLSWNSTSNRNNPITAFLSYFFEHQEQSFGYSLAPGIAYVEDNANGEFLGLFNGQFSTRTGLNFKTNLEVGKQTFFEIQALHKISYSFVAGVYFKNSSVVDQGVNNRVSGFNYGAIFKYNLPVNNVGLEAKIGTGENGFDFQLQGSYRF
ncbi:MAG: hypothetical protein KME23_19040 [Goleter apudmare HA4340-LM2]|nr:hypothetical protein [Goleter apudmare HA4340-LM2]